MVSMYRWTSTHAVLMSIAISRKTELVVQYHMLTSLGILVTRIFSNSCQLCQTHLQVTRLNTALSPLVTSVRIQAGVFLCSWQIQPANESLKHFCWNIIIHLGRCFRMLYNIVLSKVPGPNWLLTNWNINRCNTLLKFLWSIIPKLIKPSGK
jgi:hypothetical protein